MFYYRGFETIFWWILVFEINLILLRGCTLSTLGSIITRIGRTYDDCDNAHSLIDGFIYLLEGFLTKADMRRLETELPLTAEQLEQVFHSLDDNGNGFLTKCEFANGFGIGR